MGREDVCRETIDIISLFRGKRSLYLQIRLLFRLSEAKIDTLVRARYFPGDFRFLHFATITIFSRYPGQEALKPRNYLSVNRVQMQVLSYLRYQI